MADGPRLAPYGTMPAKPAMHPDRRQLLEFPRCYREAVAMMQNPGVSDTFRENVPTQPGDATTSNHLI
jgi:hypothetical protein